LQEVGGGQQMVPTDFIVRHTSMPQQSLKYPLIQRPRHCCGQASYIVTIVCTSLGLVVFFGCGYASDHQDKNTRTFGNMDGDDDESRRKLRKMSISALRYLLATCHLIAERTNYYRSFCGHSGISLSSTAQEMRTTTKRSTRNSRRLSRPQLTKLQAPHG
jgi:hypothetical protein